MSFECPALERLLEKQHKQARRDRFAAAALTGLIVNPVRTSGRPLCGDAWDLADSMLEQEWFDKRREP